jgi:FKBP-type peptidyl-prolyl cis-trans isomerase SlyD
MYRRRMEIRRNKVVALDYTLKDDAGTVIDKSGKTPLYYLHGHSNLVPGLEEALEGRKAGDNIEVSVPPEKGYGTRDPKLVSSLPKSRLPEGASPMKGQRYNLQVGNQTRTVTVTKVRINDVEIDANHALCDKTLHFAVTIRQVRDATKTELEHRHAHAPGGHH